MNSKWKKTLLVLSLCAGALWISSAIAADDHGHDHDHDHPPKAAPAASAPAVDAHEHGDDAHDAHDGHDDHGDHADEVTLTPEAIRRYGIKVEPAVRRKLLPTFTAPGRVSFNAEAMAHVGSVLTGRVVALNARLGDIVAKGDDLLVIESPELAEAQSDYLQKRTAVSVAESAIEPAAAAHERGRALYDKNEGIALAEVQKREADWKAAQGALATAKAALAAAENKLHAMGIEPTVVAELITTGKVNLRSTVRAPLNGQVVEREVTLGEGVNPDRDALLVLADMTTLWIVADVPEARLADVQVGSQAQVQIAALPGKSFDGTVTYIAAALNPETRTAAVRVDVANPDRILRPGMFARVTLSASDAGANGDAVLVVPESAVQTVEGKPAVFLPVENEPNTFAKRPVTVGKPVSGMVPVLAGLDEGQPVVTSGTFLLKADLGKNGAAHAH